MTIKKFPITSVTIGLDVRDMEYGAGTGRFVHLRADAPEGQEGLEPGEAFNKSLDMFTEAWKAVVVARYATGNSTGKDSAKLIQMFEARVDKMKKYLDSEENSDES